MKRKRRQRWIAMLMAVVMLASTMGSTGLAQSLQTESHAAQDHRSTRETETTAEEIILPDRVKEWGEEYETAATQQEADALRTQDESKNLLITAKECTLSGLDYGEIAASATDKLDLSDVKAKRFTADQVSELRLSGTELEQLYVQTVKGQSVTLRMDAETKIPEIFLEGEGSVLLEGNGALGIVRMTGALEEVTVRATCSVINESGQPVQLEMPDGDQMTLAADQQEELVLSSYQVTFIADGQIYDSKMVKPGETIPFPEQNPEKDGFIFTSWYKDEAFTENCSQFAVAEGETTLYARFVDASEAIEVTFDTMGGRELEPQIFAKGENLLTRPINEIYTEKEGYTFGGWCTDPECTTAFSYTEPLEESLTLYAFFVSEEAQETEKDGTSADLADFDWQGTIPLRTEKEMTLDEVKTNVRVEAGSGALDPELDITETENGFAISGSYYEKDGETGFEPGATFSIIVSGGVHFADYSDDTDTAVVSVYKKQVEVVGFSDDMTYVLWDDVMEYQPVVSVDEASEEEMDLETETFSETEKIEETELETVAEEGSETETESNQAVADPDGADAGEVEEAAYIPGEILVKNSDTTYQEGDIVAFYDGEIGRDEKNIDAYTEGSFDGYVLFAQILSVEDTADGVHLTYGYASPEDYLADFDVHVTDDVEMDQQLSEEDLEVLTSRLSRQVEENEELKAQMLVSVMSAPETQDMLDDLYGEGTYALAGMTATLTPGRPVVKLKVSGSEVTANISISATANIKKDGKNMLTVQPKLSFTQSLSVKTNVDGGKVWIDMSVTIRSMSKIELTVTATTGGKTTVFSKAKDTLSEIVKPEGIAEGDYESYDQSVSDLMDTMNSIVATSLKYNDLFDILLLNLKFSFYGIITVGFEVHLVGQVGVLATFGVEIVARSGERIGFKYNFLKFKGSSYTEKLESSVTNNIYLIGKVGVRVGLRLTLSVTMCGIATAYITGSLYAYAELTGLFFNTTNLLSGANTNLGALKFEVGIDVVVSLGLKVRLIFKTIRKNWTVYTGRWPLWSTSVSSSMSYMDEEGMTKLWEKSSANADHKTVFGFETIPMKTWNLMGGKCQKNNLLCAKSSGKGAKITLSVKNLMINGEAIPEGDARNALFTVGDSSKGQNPGFIYMDEKVAEEQLCEEAELDLEVTYENNSSSALVKKQTKTFHLKKKCALATTTQNVKIVLNDWCARNWGLSAADWDNKVVYETSFTSTHNLGRAYEPTATGTLNLGEIVAKVQSEYPEISQYTCEWMEPSPSQSGVIQYSVPQISSFCYMTPANGVVRYDVRPQTDAYDVTYYLYVRRFEGYEDSIRYHINLKGDDAEDTYTFQVAPSAYGKSLTFTKEAEHSYLLETRRTQFDGSRQPLMMSVNEEAAAKTGFTLTGREYQQDVYFDITIGKPILGIQLGEGVKGYQFTDEKLNGEDGIKPGSKVELQVELEEGYGGLEVTSENEDVTFQISDNKVSFIMPNSDLSIVLRAYRLHSITYLYQYGGYGTYKKVYFAENEVTKKVEDPKIDGLTFRGWYTSADGSGEAYQFGEKLLTDVTLYADWTCDVTVHFTPAKGKAAYLTGSEDAPEEHLIFENDTQEYFAFTYSTLRPGEKLLNIQIPEYDGYQFMGWYTNDEFSGKPINLETYRLSGGMDLYARWAKMVAVNFDRNDGTDAPLYAETTGFVGYPITIIPDAPERQYYTFTGWYKNKAATVAFDVQNDTITGNTTLYAGWKATTYAITYDLAGGTEAAENPTTYTTEDTITLTAPTREGYTFAGWTGTGLKEATLEVMIEPGTGGDRSYTAEWSPIEYSIEYKRAFDNLNNPVSYNIESDEIILKQPTREKYEFAGWTGTGLDQPTMEVHIPKGSMGDRIYTATWSTEDEVLSILERVAVIAGDYPYNEELAAYLSQESFMTDTIHIDYEELEGKLAQNVEKKLMELIKADASIGAYSDHIQLKLSLDKESTDRDRNPAVQKYGFRIEAMYVDDDGKPASEEPVTFNYAATLNKMIPNIVAWPEASKLQYNQEVGLSELTGGSAQYIFENLEIPVWGNFDWNTDEKEKIPFGGNNGTAASSYKVTFTPKQTECYATVEGTVGILTQTRLTVVGKTNDRDYIPGETTATGTATLVYADEAGNPTDRKCNVTGLLKEGTWSFKDDKAEENKEVTYSGYGLNQDKNTSSDYGENAYVLVNSTVISRATIRQVQQDNVKIKITAPTTESPNYEYGIELGNVKLTGGAVQYQKDDGTWLSVDGTWDWKNTSDKEKKPAAGTNTVTAAFTPDEKYHNGYGTFEAEVSVTIQKAKVSVPTIADLTYNGAGQTASVPVSSYYKVKENPSNTNAGTYTVKLELTDSANYEWEGSSSEKVTIDGIAATISYQILQAEITVDTRKASTELIQYGQKLTAESKDQTATVNGVENVKTELTAKGKVRDYSATFKNASGEDTSVNGTWAWITTTDGKVQIKSDDGKEKTVSQPLTVGTYQVKAQFIPNNSDGNLKSAEAYIPVTVQKATPYTGNVTLTAELYQKAVGEEYKLSDAFISSSQRVKNPYTGNLITGNWKWDDPEIVPEDQKSYGVTFEPDDQNYNTKSGTCLVKYTSTRKVTGVITGLQKYDGTNSGTTGDQTIDQIILGETQVIDISVKNWKGDDTVYIRKIVAEFNGKTCEVEFDKQQSAQGILILRDTKDTTHFTISFGETLKSSMRITILVCSEQYFTSLKTTKNAKLKARIMEPETELSTEIITESQTSSQDTESSEPESTTSNPAVPETTMTESPTTETTAPETQTPETEPPQTQAPETSAPETVAPQPETPAPQTEKPASETAAPQTEQPASETPAPQTEQPAPETAAAQAETSAPPQPAETQAADTQAIEGVESVQNSGDS